MIEYDEGTLLQLVHKSLQTNDVDSSITHLDELLKRYAVDQRIEQIKDTLTRLVEQYPDVPAIRTRYAAVQMKSGNTVRLVEELSILAKRMDKLDE